MSLGPHLARTLRTLMQDLGDVALSRTCVACAADEGLLCRSCRARLPRYASRRQLSVDAWYAGEYEGIVRAMVLAHKELGYRALTPPLGELLAEAILTAARQAPQPWVLVPVPPHRSSLHERGRDCLQEVARSSARQLRERGLDCRVTPILAWQHEVGRNTGTTARSRRGSERVLVARDRHMGTSTVVVIDDVITTGGTVEEAVRALRGVGIRPHAIAAVASRSLRTR